MPYDFGQLRQGSGLSQSPLYQGALSNLARTYLIRPGAGMGALQFGGPVRAFGIQSFPRIPGARSLPAVDFWRQYLQQLEGKPELAEFSGGVSQSKGEI